MNKNEETIDTVTNSKEWKW